MATIDKSVFKSFESIIFSQDLVKKSRCVALILTPFMFVIIILMYFKFIPAENLVFYSNIVIFFLSIFLIIWPYYVKILALLCSIAFFVNISVGGEVLGLIFFCLNLLILLRCNFFKKHKVVKIIFLTIFFISALVFQYIRFGAEKLSITLFNAVIVFVLILFVIIFFFNDIKAFFNRKEQLHISNYDLNERQYESFILVSKDLSIKQIAEILKTSDSVIKKELTVLYKIFKVKNFKELQFFISNHEIID